MVWGQGIVGINVCCHWVHHLVHCTYGSFKYMTNIAVSNDQILLLDTSILIQNIFEFQLVWGSNLWPPDHKHLFLGWHIKYYAITSTHHSFCMHIALVPGLFLLHLIMLHQVGLCFHKFCKASKTKHCIMNPTLFIINRVVNVCTFLISWHPHKITSVTLVLDSHLSFWQK